MLVLQTNFNTFVSSISKLTTVSAKALSTFSLPHYPPKRNSQKINYPHNIHCPNHHIPLKNEMMSSKLYNNPFISPNSKIMLVIESNLQLLLFTLNFSTTMCKCFSKVGFYYCSSNNPQ